MAFTVERLGYQPHLVDYRDAWALQSRYHDDVVRGDRPSTLLLLEHAAVYTAGRRTEDHERPTDGTAVIDVDRGGKITWHGPGQLVAYTIYRLEDPKDVRLFVEQLEQAIIALMTEHGIAARTVDGRAGVWLPADDRGPVRKIAAIGIRIHDGVTMHGLAVNCSNESTGFDSIIPCGIVDAGVTTMSQELGRIITPAQVADRLAELLDTRISA
ncbi:lipoyl(octanoyl) transferase LipB [Brevibacterium jeotgali]|uniref:Octanoyltransferase n=1 Tax=Brevibacterium jeotgali TaxID=1262550 RepID=A0A2H1L898_9MICO|nr:lipoyl(octanoyl) transferase LipB [Brevibacterium jeotgali]TWC02750.1 lipoyl(octanoyl) transferase [Brevibacterium jeotgali]SMY13134.1 lipoyl(octanoyl) transferase [Brevibacterium jeotgali]